LADIQKQGECAREEVIRYTEETLHQVKKQNAISEPIEKSGKTSNAGKMENDEDTAQRLGEKNLSDRISSEIYKSLMEEREKDLKARMKLDQEKLEWEAREAKLLKKLEDERQRMEAEKELTLKNLMEIEAQKYGIDYGNKMPERKESIRSIEQQTDACDVITSAKRTASFVKPIPKTEQSMLASTGEFVSSGNCAHHLNEYFFNLFYSCLH